MRASIPSSAKVVMTAHRAASRTAKVISARQNTTHPLDAAILRERLSRLDMQRQAQGCTLVALAGALGISRSMLTRVLHGQQTQRGRAHELMTLEGLQRIEIALALFARAAAKRQPTPGTMKQVRHPAELVGGARPRVRRAAARAAREVRPQRAASAAVAERGIRDVRVLVVEDDAPTVELYRLVLAEEHTIRYIVDVARTAQECLECLRGAQPYDVLLMDLGVSDVHGESDEKSLLATFERQPRILPRHILVVSGISPYQLRLKRERLASLGAAYMSKPFDVDELLVALRSLVLTADAPAQSLSFFAAPTN